jgi:hypothetical protein
MFRDLCDLNQAITGARMKMLTGSLKMLTEALKMLTGSMETPTGIQGADLTAE